MKKLIPVIFLLLCFNLVKSQTIYYSYLTEKLLAMKEEAVKNSDYDKAAYLKKELDKREAEMNKVIDLQTQLDLKVNSESFEEAAVLKEELSLFKRQIFLKDSLRKEIDLAFKAEKYNEMSELKTQLKGIETEMEKSHSDQSETVASEPAKLQTNNQNHFVETQPTKQTYIEKVREVQNIDPGIIFYVGNGWLIGRSLFNPLVGIDFRFSKKNVFVRGFSLGVRACLQNVLEDGDRRTGYNSNGSTNLEKDGPVTFDSYNSAGGMVTLKYYAPIPLKKIQPYIISMAGVGVFTKNIGTIYWDPVLKRGVESYVINERAKLEIMIGSGVGCNFLLSRRFGFFIEGGYFRMSLINTGLVLKL